MQNHSRVFSLLDVATRVDTMGIKRHSVVAINNKVVEDVVITVVEQQVECKVDVDKADVVDEVVLVEVVVVAVNFREVKDELSEEFCTIEKVPGLVNRKPELKMDVKKNGVLAVGIGLGILEHIMLMVAIVHLETITKAAMWLETERLRLRHQHKLTMRQMMSRMSAVFVSVMLLMTPELDNTSLRYRILSKPVFHKSMVEDDWQNCFMDIVYNKLSPEGNRGATAESFVDVLRWISLDG